MGERLAVAGFLATAIAIGAATPPARAASQADVQLIAHVAERIFAEAAPPVGMLWPPRVIVAQRDDVVAYAEFGEAGAAPAWAPHSEIVDMTPLAVPLGLPAAGGLGPAIVLSQGLLDQVVQGSADRLAAILAHQAAHLLASHPAARPGDGPRAASSECCSHDAEALMLGMKLGLQADFPYKRLVAGHAAMWRHLARAAGNDGPSAPAPADRAALIDSRQSELWPSIATLEYGAYFLAMQRYALAESCFRQVATECPGCAPALANLGYVQLMQYCDRLEPENLQDLDVGMLAVAGFCRRPDALEGTTRGLGPEVVELWFDAVGSLRQALILQPDLVPAKAHLALAYLVGPEGKDVGRARELFDQARSALAEGAEPLEPRAHAALLVNAGVAALAAHDSAAAEELFAEAQALCGVAGQGAGSSAELAIQYHRARQLAASAHDAVRRRGVGRYETFLRSLSTASAWWSLAYDQYAQLCQETGSPSKSRSSLRTGADAQGCHVAGLLLSDGATVDLGARLAALAESLPGGESRTLVRRSNIRRIRYHALGLEVLGGEWIGAIRLHDAGAAVLISDGGTTNHETTASPRSLRCGMTVAELDHALGDEQTRWEPGGASPQAVDRYYPRLGLGVRLGNEGRVTQITVASPAIAVDWE